MRNKIELILGITIMSIAIYGMISTDKIKSIANKSEKIDGVSEIHQMEIYYDDNTNDTIQTSYKKELGNKKIHINSALYTVKSKEEKKDKKAKTIYDAYPRSEVDILNRIVEAETTDCSIEAKQNVANVILNRVESDKFPGTIESVVFESGQFSPILDGRFWDVEITDSTIKACEDAFVKGDETDGALFFCNKRDVKNLNKLKWFNKLEYIITDDSGHSFYK